MAPHVSRKGSWGVIFLCSIYERFMPAITAKRTRSLSDWP